MYLRFPLMFNRAAPLHECVCLLATALLSSLWLSLYSSLHSFTFINELHYFDYYTTSARLAIISTGGLEKGSRKAGGTNLPFLTVQGLEPAL